MAKTSDDVVRIGFDTSDFLKGEAELKKACENISKSFKITETAGSQLTKQGQLMHAAFAGITSDGRNAIATFKQLAGTIAEINTQTGKVRFRSAETGLFVAANKALQQTGLQYTDKTQSASGQKLLEQRQQYEKWLIDGKAAWAKRLAQEKQDYDLWTAAGRKAWAEKLMQERRDFQQWLIAGKTAWAQKLLNERRDLETWAQQGKVAYAKKRAEERQQAQQERRDFIYARKQAMELQKEETAPTRASKFFNQAAAITTGIMISQAFMRVTSSISESITAAANFQIKMSEIRTLSQESQLSIGQWTNEVRKLSETFGVDVFDVAAGLYETISNQIAQGAEATYFMAEAQKFAAVTVTSTNNAVNLLSSALNAYGLKTTDTTEVAASFFKLIDLGRVRADELANSYGMTAPIAAQLGVSINDLNAMFAAMTIQGVKFNNASTYTRNILQALLKPSEAFKKTIQSWGVSSGEAAIQTFGLVGVLEKINEIVEKGGLEELADNFKNLRQLQGGSLLSGAGADILKRDIEKFKNAASSYAGAKKIAFESSGKLLEIEYAKLKAIFLFDFATPMVNAFVKVTSAMGGLANMFTATAKIVAAGTAAWATYAIFSLGFFGILTKLATGFYTVKLALISLNTFVLANPWTALATAIAAVVTYLVLYRKTDEETNKEIIANAKAASAELNQEMRERYTKQEQALKESMEKQYQTVFSALASIRSKYSELGDRVKESFDTINESLETSIDTFKTRLAEGIENVTTRLSNLKSMVKSLKTELLSFTEKRDLDTFEDSITDLTSGQKAAAEMARAIQLQTKAKETQQQAKQLLISGNVPDAQEAFARAKQLFDEALSLADRAQKNNASGAKSFAKDYTKLNKEIDTTTEHVNKLAKQIALLSTTGKSNPRNAIRMKELLATYDEEKKKLEDLQADKGTLDTQNVKLGLTQQQNNAITLQKELVDQITAAYKEQIELAEKKKAQDEETLKNLKSARETILKSFKEALGVTLKPKDSDKDVQNKIDQITEAQQKLAEAMQTDPSITGFGEGLNLIAQLQAKKDLIEGIVKVKNKEAELDAKQKEINSRKQQQEEKLKEAEDTRNKYTKDFAENLKVTIDLLSKITDLKFEGENIDVIKATTIQENIKNTIKNIGSATSNEIITQQALILGKLVLDFKTAMDEGGNADVNESIAYAPVGMMMFYAEQLEQANKAVKAAQPAIDQIKAEANSLQTLYKQTFESNAEAVISSNKLQMASFKELIQSIKTDITDLKGFQVRIEALPGVGATRKAFGGFARGLDTIPAMLSPGEFVVNSGATKRFYSQLVAMNSGGVRHMANGGFVSNNRFGDINVTVAGGKSSITTARDIGLALRRELRRGTLPPL